MLKETLTSPLQSDHRFKTFGIGTGLQFSAILVLAIGAMLGGEVFLIGGLLTVVLMTFYWGYYLRVLRQSANEKTELPAFNNWSNLGINGVKFFAIALGYMAIPIFLLTVGSLTARTGGTIAVISSISFVLALLIFFISLFLLPIGLMMFSLTDRIRKAFAVREVVGAAVTKSYILTVIMSLPFLLCLNIIEGLGTFPQTIHILFLYMVISSLLSFYLLVVIFSLLGQGCSPHLLKENGEEIIN